VNEQLHVRDPQGKVRRFGSRTLQHDQERLVEDHDVPRPRRRGFLIEPHKCFRPEPHALFIHLEADVLIGPQEPQVLCHVGVLGDQQAGEDLVVRPGQIEVQLWDLQDIAVRLGLDVYVGGQPRVDALTCVLEQNLALEVLAAVAGGIVAPRSAPASWPSVFLALLPPARRASAATMMIATIRDLAATAATAIAGAIGAGTVTTARAGSFFRHWILADSICRQVRDVRD